MIRSRAKLLTIALLARALVAGPASALAARADHLECYKFNDSAGRRSYTADLGGLRSELGCKVLVPAKLLCVDTTKSNVVPPPPGAPAGSAAGRFLCYTLRCRKAKLPVTVTDQFGSRPGSATVSKLLCAPADFVSIQSTTTTVTSTSTTSTTIP